MVVWCYSFSFILFHTAFIQSFTNICWGPSPFSSLLWAHLLSLPGPPYTLTSFLSLARVCPVLPIPSSLVFSNSLPRKWKILNSCLYSVIHTKCMYSSNIILLVRVKKATTSYKMNKVFYINNSQERRTIIVQCFIQCSIPCHINKYDAKGVCVQKKQFTTIQNQHVSNSENVKHISDPEQHFLCWDMLWIWKKWVLIHFSLTDVIVVLMSKLYSHGSQHHNAGEI